MDNTENKEGCCGTKKTSCATETSCSTEKTSCGIKGCIAKMLKGAVVGGIILFAVFALACKFVPVHKDTIITYSKAQEIVVEAPSMAKAMRVIGQELKSAMSSEQAPVVVEKSTTKQLGATLLLSLLGGALLTGLMKCSHGCPVRFSALTGLLVGIVAYAPGYIWFAAPLNFALIGVATTLVAFILAGIGIAKLVLKCGGKSACH